jgi:hypothetical protein
LVRPDHYVYGVAVDSATLSELTHALIRDLHTIADRRQTRTHDEISKL